MVYSAEKTVERAKASKTNIPQMCQGWVVQMFGAKSVGDVNGDGDADALDGWASEPEWAKHHDRNPPAGVPVAFGGGQFGHRAVSIGGGLLRSTDAGGPGRVATVSIAWIENHWNKTYLGWSETISGEEIPGVGMQLNDQLWPHSDTRKATVRTALRRIIIEGERDAKFREDMKTMLDEAITAIDDNASPAEIKAMLENMDVNLQLVVNQAAVDEQLAQSDTPPTTP